MIGVDEVGRGCLAGPLLVVAARQKGKEPKGLNDSKKLTRRQRETIYDLLIANYQFGEGWVRPAEIDRRGLTGAMRLGIVRALKQLDVRYEEDIILDGPINYFSARYKKVECLIDADAAIPLVSAASVYAKVRRDRFMATLADRYPQYGFDRHVGYGTPEHLRAIDKFGALRHIHRQLFAPVSRLNQAVSWRLLA